MRQAVTMFSGGGGFDYGITQAGFEVINAIDFDRDVCAHYRRNHGRIICANLMQIEPLELCDRGISLMVGSPPCPSFSDANIGGAETVFDVALSNRIGFFIRKIKPRAMLFENVGNYQRSISFKELMATIENLGYTVDHGLYNAADFGVAQTRERLFIRAVRGAKSRLEPVVRTHCEKGVSLPLWRGWGEVLADMINDLPEAKLTKPQQNVVQDAINDCMIQRLGYYKGKPKFWDCKIPIGTIRASLGTDGKKPDHKPDDFRGYNRPNYMTIWLKGNPCFQGKNVTIQALSRLQGWPDGVSFTGEANIDVHVVGNSVCPPVAEALVKSMVF